MKHGPLVATLAIALVALPPSSRADGRRVEIRFTPTARAQMAIWLESSDGSLFQTLALTEAVSYRGIGNRPGALQMNSSFHWPYGRREGVLPVWAHRRATATGVLFPRVVFAGRVSEGNASSAGSPGEVTNTRDDYFCLSFTPGDESLDAMSCASVFNSDKGRYLTDADVAGGYAEPWQGPDGSSQMRPLAAGSLYPPRQDYAPTPADPADVARFVSDAHAVMPEIDAVSLATPRANAPFMVAYDVPAAWPDGDYIAYVEVNTEGDYATGWDPSRYPTPHLPAGRWDVWAETNGYPYRGQPSVVFAVPFRIVSSGSDASASHPVGYGALEGETGELQPMDATIHDDSAAHAGSGADRLVAGPDGVRVRVSVPTRDVCMQPSPPVECGRGCDATRPCSAPLLCSPDGACVGECDLPMTPGAPSSLTLTTFPDPKHSHQWAHMHFLVPETTRAIRSYEARFGTNPIVDDASFAAARPARAASLEDEALTVPADALPGATVDVDFGGLSPETRYFVGVRAIDTCNSAGPVSAAEITTTAIHFSTVSPCFIATAAYGSPLDARIGSLRRFRDRELLPNAPGRALVRLYYMASPPIARWIAESEERRAFVRGLLDPLVTMIDGVSQ